MQLGRKQRSVLKMALAALLALLLPVIGLLAVDGELHKALCAGADAQDHQCAATMFSQGHVAALDAPAVFTCHAAWPPRIVVLAIEPELTPVDFLLLPERGPPAVLS